MPSPRQYRRLPPGAVRLTANEIDHALAHPRHRAVCYYCDRLRAKLANARMHMEATRRPSRRQKTEV